MPRLAATNKTRREPEEDKTRNTALRLQQGLSQHLFPLEWAVQCCARGVRATGMRCTKNFSVRPGVRHCFRSLSLCVWGLSGGTGGTLLFVEPVGLLLAHVCSILLIHRNILSAVQSCGEWGRGGHKLFSLLRNTQEEKMLSCKKNPGMYRRRINKALWRRKKKSFDFFFSVGRFANTRLQELASMT